MPIFRFLPPRWLLAGVLALISLGFGQAEAAVMKCTGSGGKLTYTDEGCPRHTEKRQLVRTGPEGGSAATMKALPAAGAGTGTSPGGGGGGDNGGSGPAPTVVGNAPALNPVNSAGKPTSGFGAPSDPGQTVPGSGSTAPTDVASPVPATP